MSMATAISSAPARRWSNWRGESKLGKLEAAPSVICRNRDWLLRIIAELCATLGPDPRAKLAEGAMISAPPRGWSQECHCGCGLLSLIV
jgi:hypothetical protein